MRLLVVANVVPYPPHGGIQARLLNLLERVARRHEVTLCCHARSEADVRNAALLTGRGIRTIIGRLPPYSVARFAARAAGMAIRALPPEFAGFRSRELARKLNALVREESFDVLQIEETTLTPYATLVPRAAVPRRTMTFHNVRFEQVARIADLETRPGRRLWRRFNALCMRLYEPRVARRFDRCVAVTEHDRQLLLAANPAIAVDVVPNGVDTRALQPLPPSGGASLLFVGNMSYKPCEDAAVWLVREILPIVRRRAPGAEVSIVGRDPTARVRALAGDGVVVTGEVDDLLPFYERAAVTVAPLRAGGGSRLKILEAMALGRPVISTTVGAEGLDAAGGRHLLLADSASAFAEAVVRSLGDSALRGSLADAARSLVEARYDWDTIAAMQMRVYGELLASR